MKAVHSVGPYARGARGYWENGWTPIPLPSNKKYPPESGWTGGQKLNSGEPIPEGQLKVWVMENGDGNICLRAPKNVIGLDVDMYGSKTGGQTFDKAIQEWGELPDTWISTSRNDGSGIRWFRIPEGLAWPGELPQGKGVETIKWDNRYGVVAPSIHPEGMEYVWIDPEGRVTTEEDGWEFPAIDELANLPQTWIDGLTSGKPWAPRDEADMDPQAVRDWLTDRGEDPMCAVMERTLQGWLQKIRMAGEDGGAHEDMLRGIWALIGDSAAGHKGIRPALERAMASFKEAVAGRRSKAEASAEWRRAVADGVRKVAAEGEPEDEDICALGATSQAARTSKRAGVAGSAEFDYERNDGGNGRRFARKWKDRAVWIDGLGGWHIWHAESGRWQLDIDGEATRMALATVSAINDEVGFLEDEKERAKLRSFINNSSNEARIKAMLNMAKSMKGMTMPATRFNANPAQLVVGNGTVDLNPRGARFKPSLSTDYNTVGCDVDYAPGADGSEWEAFLARSIPDAETRSWVQRAAGYSLLGSNTARLFFIVQGETSSGKSTFGEVIRDVLGQYGAAFELNLFRSQKEQGPNVQLVRLLPKRFIVASEASAEVYLHADQIKRVTGGEALSGRLNRSNEMVERVPAFTPWLVTNAAPTVRGADLALYRRIYTIPFNETIDQASEDQDLGHRLKSSGAAGVLAWLVEGWNAYTRVGLRDLPHAIVQATLKTQEELSEFDIWLHEQCVRGAEETSLAAELYNAYCSWCEDARLKPESSIEFGRMLGKRGLKRNMVRIDPNGDRNKKARGWVGISLKNDGPRVKSTGG